MIIGRGLARCVLIPREGGGGESGGGEGGGRAAARAQAGRAAAARAEVARAAARAAEQRAEMRRAEMRRVWRQSVIAVRGESDRVAYLPSDFEFLPRRSRLFLSTLCTSGSIWQICFYVLPPPPLAQIRFI